MVGADTEGKTEKQIKFQRGVCSSGTAESMDSKTPKKQRKLHRSQDKLQPGVDLDSKTTDSQGKLRPGMKKVVSSYREDVNNRKQAFMQRKTRIWKQLNYQVEKLMEGQNQVLDTPERSECLFIMYDKIRNKYRYCGFGDILMRFEEGLPLSDKNPKKAKK